MKIIQQKIRILAFLCLMGSQPQHIKADIKEIVYSCLNQVLQNKEMCGCLAAIAGLFAAYKGHIRYRVYQAEQLLQLDKINPTESYGFLGEKLFNRNEAMARVFSCVQNKDPHWFMQSNEKEELKQLVANTTIARELVKRQELGLMNDIAYHAPHIWKLDSYHKDAREMLNMNPPQHSSSGIGYISTDGEQEAKEAFDKLNTTQRKHLALKAFCDNTFTPCRLDTWIDNSIYLKDQLTKIKDASKEISV